MKTPPFTYHCLSLALLSSFAQAADQAQQAETEVGTTYVTAERQLQQSLGVSKISESDIAKRPIVNDASEIVRTMPGVNLTGNSTSGSRGNKRQIDIRGMGPENTLILIDGKPVTSRNAERMTRTGERNTRGDSNWVPPEAIESISVLRGPAAARYGSGAMGGVVNIVTKKITNEFQGSVGLYTNQPQDDKEGDTKRIGFNLSGPIVPDVLSFRLYGNVSKTDADHPFINGTDRVGRDGGQALVAGVEGVRNKDIAGRLHWKISPSQSLTLDNSFSRQGSIYSGDTQYSDELSDLTRELIGRENARLYRHSTSLTHDGSWEWGDTQTYLQYDRTTNSRYPEGLTGGIEGVYNGEEYTDSILKNYRLGHESHIPFDTGSISHVLTAGAEANRSELDDAMSTSQPLTGRGRNGRPYDHGTINGQGSDRPSKTSQNQYAVYLEDNISFGTDGNTKLIPTLRYDYNNKFGSNLSPGLNFSHQLNPNWTIKGGVARAYKTPNLYQTNSNYLLFSRGNGCTNGETNCYLQGNDNLKPETSLNKEIGFEFNQNGYQASLAYFHNAYRDKIAAGTNILARSSAGNAVYGWENVGKAVVEGFEGNLVLPLHKTLRWSNNFTYMRRSINKETGQALSLIPKYTINSTLSWMPTEKLDANLIYTYYGKQAATVGYADREDAEASDYTPVPRYGIMGINVGYKWNKHIDTRLGISNLFDKKILRTNQGASSYNEHGRSFYGSLKLSF